MNHTKGEWIFKPERGVWLSQIITHGDRVALLKEQPTVADGRLMAAAPELLAELIEARRQLREYELEASGECYNRPSQNAAIDKALGND